MVLSNIIHNNNISNNIIYLILVFIYNNQKYLSIVQLIINLQYCLRCYIPIILLSNARHFNMWCYGWEAKQSICQVLACFLQFNSHVWHEVTDISCFQFQPVNAVWLCIVAFLWGFTNPFIKRAGSGIESIKKENHVSQFFAELKFLFTNWKVSKPVRWCNNLFVIGFYSVVCIYVIFSIFCHFSSTSWALLYFTSHYHQQVCASVHAKLCPVCVWYELNPDERDIF